MGSVITVKANNTPHSVQKQQPVISIIIDDIGWRKQDDLRALALPGSLSYAILPQTPNARLMARTAAENNKEVILHVPMEAQSDNHLLGPGALRKKMTRREFLETLDLNFQSVPNAIGLNNHMGSELTRHELSMHRLMDALKTRGNVFFIDSGTTGSPLPTETAKLYGITSTRRDVFLDHEQSEHFVKKQFQKLIRLAKKQGSALGIGHPHPVTVETLQTILPNLADYGVRLVSISEFMQIRSQELPFWHASSSP